MGRSQEFKAGRGAKKINGSPLVPVHFEGGRRVSHYETTVGGKNYRIERDGPTWRIAHYEAGHGFPISTGHKSMADAARELAMRTFRRD